MELGLLRGTQRTHGVIPLVHHQFLEAQHDQRAEHDDDGQRRCHVGVGGAFGHILVIHENRQHGITLAQQHGGAEVSQTGHEHHDAACQNGGQDNGQRHRPDAPDFVHAQILGGFLQGTVDAVHGAGGVQVDVGEQVQGKHEDDTAATVDRGRGHADLRQRPCYQTVTAQQDDPGISADEGRAHQAHDDEDVQNFLARNVVAGDQISDGNAHQCRGKYRGEAHDHGAKQRLIVVGLGEETLEVIQRDALYLAGKHALRDDGVEGVDNEQAHCQNHEQLCEEPEIRFPAGIKPFVHRLSTSSLLSYRLMRMGSKLR